MKLSFPNLRFPRRLSKGEVGVFLGTGSSIRRSLEGCPRLLRKPPQDISVEEEFFEIA